MVHDRRMIPSVGAGSCLSGGGERIHPGRMKAFYLLAASLFFVSVSCERHDWEDTKKLHETHGHDSHDSGSDEGDH